jgi:Protein of unknown function (DUF429)
MRVIAVDWSGKDRGEAEHVWLAEVRDGEIATLENGRTRASLIKHIIALAQSDPRLVVGFDFAFSFPKWWSEARGWHTGRDVWHAMAAQAEDLLEACEYPFWGRPGKPNPHSPEKRFRRTEREDNKTAKSVFQIGGAGAVGTGSLRGMPHLHTLAKHEFYLWPFDALRFPGVIEIYPRALTGPVNKTRWTARHSYLRDHFPAQPATMLERAAGSEDAFDAAVSALVMAAHEDRLLALEATTDAEFAIEGRIWQPEP